MTDYPSSPDKCDNDISTATIGEPICIPFTQKFTVNPSRVNITQKSSQYCIALQGFSVNVSSDIFVRQIGDWIIYFNSSRTYQQFRFVKKTATCDSIGIYELSLYNGVDNLTPFEFTIRLKDPTLQQSVTRIYGFIHVHCEMTANCIASSLVLVVNNEPTSKELPDTNVCSNNDMMGGTKLAVDETFRISKLSVNQTISCVPVMKNIELAANLTSTTTVPFCEGDDCVFGCKEESQSISYYSNIDFCDRFYQCSNGILVSHSCGNGTYWSPSECNCDHFDGAICDQKTKRFSKPVTSKKCSP
ncbi:uncharacterized protein LOC134709772 [Mytilus trossulus]|uniref:uncharacterized protein LOC134709772 n=1 Tax=Mytilus trossulus TaxID=6551 RepID=UPI003003A7F9